MKRYGQFLAIFIICVHDFTELYLMRKNLINAIKISSHKNYN
jgi:hypothetical protein